VVNLGKWYDPISERWIAPREPLLEPKFSPVSANHVLELQRTVEIQRIWRTLVDCCSHD
jgi:hypothetical protein